MNLRLRWLIPLLLLAAAGWAQTTNAIGAGTLAVSCNAVTAATSNNPGTAGGCASLALPAPNGQLPGGFTWQTITTGSPATVSIQLMGSIDNINWTQLDISTATAGEIRSVTGKPMRFIGCIPGTLSGGTSPTLTCQVTVTTSSAGGGGGGGSGTVTSVGSGNGLTGTVTTSGSLAVETGFGGKDCSQSAGADAGAQINACISGSGVFNAGNITGAVAINGTSPIPSSNPHGIVRFGNATYWLTGSASSIVVSTELQLEGQGQNSTQGQNFNTVFRACNGETTGTPCGGTSFPKNTPIFCFGTGGSCGGAVSNAANMFGSRLRNIVIDCNGIQGCVGVQNKEGQENLGLSYIMVLNWGNSTVATGLSVSESGNTVTVTSTLNPPVDGPLAVLSGCSVSGYNGAWPVLTTSGSNFTLYNNITSGLSSATGCTVNIGGRGIELAGETNGTNHVAPGNSDYDHLIVQNLGAGATAWNCTVGSYGIFFSDSTGTGTPKGIDTATITNSYCNTHGTDPAIDLEISNGTTVANGPTGPMDVRKVHCESSLNCVMIGDLSATNGIALTAIGDGASNQITISNNYVTSGITAVDTTAFFGNIIKDQVGNHTISNTAEPSGTIGFYSLGSNGVMTTANSVNGASINVAAGVVADEVRLFDGSMTSLITQGNTTTPTTPTYTTNFPNAVTSEVVFSCWDWTNGTVVNWSAVPATGTNIIDIVQGTNLPGLYCNFQTVSSAGSVGGLSGTMSAAVKWDATTLALVPTAGHSVGTRNATCSGTPCGGSNQTTGTTITLNGLTGETTGDLLIADIVWNPASFNSLTVPGPGWQLLFTIQNATNQINNTFFAKVATSSDTSSSTYVFTQAVSGTMGAGLAIFSNVAYPDELLTAAGYSGTVNTQNATTLQCTSNCVTWVTGTSFAGLSAGSTIVINGSNFTISTVYTSKLVSVTSAPGTQTGVTYTSATITNLTGATGKDICVGSGASPTAAVTPQSCGTIGVVVTSTSAIGYGIWNTGTLSSNLIYVYGTDNSTALQNAINNAPNGGTVRLPIGGMMFNQTLNWPNNASSTPLNLFGQGAGSWTAEAANVAAYSAISMGSELVYASSTCTGPALVLQTLNQYSMHYHFQNFSLTGGAGRWGDGGGAYCGTTKVTGNVYGIEALSLANATFDDIRVSNFGYDGINVLFGGGWNTFKNVLSYFNGGDGIGISPNSSGVTSTQNIEIIGGAYDANCAAGVELGNPAGATSIWNFTIQGASISRNNAGCGQTAVPGTGTISGAEFLVDASTSVLGCGILPNYWETDVASQAMVNSAAPLACSWSTQAIVLGASGSFTNANVFPTVTGTGACGTLGTLAGGPASISTGGTGNFWGPLSGSVPCNGSTGASTLIITYTGAAQNGLQCTGADITTGVAGIQTASSTTACTLTFSSVTSTNTVNFSVRPF